MNIFQKLHLTPYESLAEFLSGECMAFTRLADSEKQFDEYFENGDFCNSGLEDVACNLTHSFGRLFAHAHVPDAFFDYGQKLQMAHAHFCLELGIADGGRTLGVLPANGIPDRSKDEVWKQLRKKMADWVNGAIPDPSWRSSDSTADVAGYVLRSHPDPHFDPMPPVNALYRSVIIEAWTLFEALSEELWEAALNNHPKTLSLMRGRSRDTSRYRKGNKETQEHPDSVSQSNDENEDENDSGIQVSINRLQKSQFNVAHCMGTVLIENEVVSFRSIKKIRDAYHRAFSKHSQSIDAILDDADLQCVAAIRNLIVHKRGIVDAEFVKQTSRAQGRPILTIGQPFEINGAHCNAAADTCISCSHSLVNAVHRWIVSHP